MLYGWTLLFSLLVRCFEHGEASVFLCADDISSTECSTIQSTGQCDTVKGRNDCKKTCDFCGGWTSWSNWGDCSTSKCGETGERSRGRRCRQKLSVTDCLGSSIDIQKCVSDSCYESQCGSDQFKCISYNTSSEDCFSRSRICDGYSDCMGDFDEIDCKVAGGPIDDFFIASVPNNRHCLKARTDGIVDFTWDCPNRNYKTAYSQLWKWRNENNLINIETGMCLTILDRSLVLETCDSAYAAQLWTCNEKSLELTDHSKTIRYIGFDGNKVVAGSASTMSWQNGETGDSICANMHGWSDWSSWSDCMPKCSKLGQGEISRSRYCSNGRCNGSAVEKHLCDHHLCRPTCPPGFSSDFFPWSCYKLINERESFHEASHICSTLGNGEVNYHAVLAADKNSDTNLAFKQMMKTHNVSEAYIGVNIVGEGVSLKEFTFTMDGEPVGMLGRRKWHDTSFGDFIQKEEDVPWLYRIKNGGGDCLDIADNGEVLTVQCGNDGTLWTAVNRLLYHINSERCLAWTDSICDPSEASCTPRLQYKIISKVCSFSDKYLNWDFGSRFLRPYGSNIHFVTVIARSVLIDVVSRKAWLAWSESRGVQRLSQLRMDSGTWEIYMYGDLCLSATDDFKVKLDSCNQNMLARWNRISENHILHRKTGLCLSVADNLPVDGSKLQLQSCDHTVQLQKWLIANDGDGMHHFIPWLNRELTPTPDVSGSGDLSLGVFNTLKNPYWVIKSFVGSYEKFRIFNPYVGLEYCWKPKDVGCSDSQVIPSECNDVSTSSWWMWDAYGQRILSKPLDGYNIGSCCLHSNNQAFEFPSISQCQENSRNGDEGIALHDFPNIIFATENDVISTLDMAAEHWKVMQYPDSSEMGVNVLRSCQTNSGGLEHALHQHTESGVSCQAWSQQIPHKHNYPSVDHNFCSSPAGYESETDKAWCLTTDPTKRWEECKIPKCFDSLVIALSSDGEWKLSNGESKRAFLCEASIECIEGIGENYNGTVRLAGSGKPCLNWRSVQARIHGGSASSVPDHSFCRNPDADPRGPWCWTTNFVKEYCDYIQKCPVRCSAPPLPIGGSVGHIEYKQGGPRYANESKIWYSCDEDRERSRPFTSEEDYDLMCIDGKWIGAMVACNLRYCMTPADGVQNSFAYPGKKVLYEDTYTYRCYEGFMFSTGNNSLTLTCNGNNTWSTMDLPAENYQLDKSRLRSDDFSQIACLKSCQEGYESVSDWCVKVEHSSLGIPCHDARLSCPSGTHQATIETGMNPHIAPHLRKTKFGKFLLDVSSIGSMDRSFSNTGFVSKYTNLTIPEDHILSATFFIKTKSTYSLHGSDEYLCVYSEVSTTNKLDIFAMITRCPAEGDRPTEFLFRWYTARHLLNVKTQKCLTRVSYKAEWFGFAACDQNSHHQMWNCDVDAIFSYRGHEYIELIHPSSTRTEYRLKPALLWENAVTFMAARSNDYPGTGIYFNDVGILIEPSLFFCSEKNVCDEELKPRDKIFSISCVKGINDRNCDADTLNSDTACALNLGTRISQGEYDSWNTKPCKCGWIKNKATPQSGCHHVTCSDDSTFAWCKRPVSAGWVHLASGSRFCLASDISTGEVVEVPCEIPVMGKVCKKKTLFACYPPALKLDNGHIKDTKDWKRMIYHPLYPVGGSVSYVCDDGYLFIDGTVSKEITCLNSGTWTPPTKHFECVPAACATPSQPVNAAKIDFPEYSTQLDLGTVVNVRCNQGYVIAPGVVTLSSVCRDDGKWHPPIGSCKPNRCGEPPYVRNTVTVGTSFTLYSNITYKCVYGMHFNGMLPLVGSKHTCLKDGEWSPSVSGLTCIKTRCPTVDNIVASSGDGVDQTVTVDCSNPSEYLSGKDTYTQDPIKSICNASGEWVPPVTGLKCIDPLCDEATMITNADFIGYNPSQAKGRLEYATVAKYSCIEGYVSVPHFLIYSNVTQGTCISTIKLDEVFRIRLLSECDKSISAAMLWRWWPQQTKLLQHVQSGLCLMHSIVDEAHQGGVHLDACDKYQQKQMWNCQKTNGKHYLSTFSVGGKSSLYLKHKIEQKGLHLSDTFDTYGTQWMGKDLNDICNYRTRQRNFNLICSTDGSWIPRDTTSICFPVKCNVPDESKGTYYSGHGGSTEMSVGTEIIAVCEQGYEIADGVDTFTFHCSGNAAWVPDISSNKCKPVSCGQAPVFMSSATSSGSLGNLYMSEILVTCDDGLWFEELKTNQLKISCGRDGTWSLTERHSITCSPIRCPSDYKIPENAYLLAGHVPSNHYGAKIEVSCREGYRFESFSTLATVFCGGDGTWIPSDLSCGRSYCAPPPTATSYASLISEVPEKSPLSFKATYECREYTHVSGSKFFDVFCTADGSWNPDPKTVICHHETCIDPHLWKMEHNLNGNGTEIGDIVAIRCHEGYMYPDSKTSKTSRCAGSEGWNPPLEILKCQQRTCPLSTTVPNLMIKPVTGFRYGDFANVTCDVGFTLSLRKLKYMTVVCSSKGVWMPLVSSLQCYTIVCNVPSVASNVVFELNSLGRTTIGSLATLSCIDGYISNIGLQKRHVKCNAFGEWFPTISDFQCLEHFCEKGVEFQPQCPKSFWIPPENTVETQPFCAPSVDSIQESPCKPITCVDLPVVSYADISEHVPGSFGSLAVGAKVTYRCRDQYHFHLSFEAKTAVTCMSSGMWNPDPFQLKCIAISCKTPSNAVNEVHDHKVGDTIDVSCKPGYQLPDDMDRISLSCQSDGRWSPYHENGPCQSIDCGKPIQIAFSRASVTDTHLGSKAHYRCYEGYKVGLTTYSWFATCNDNGVWEPTDLQCIPDDKFFCDMPKSMPNSRRYLPSTYLKGEEVTYVCDEGYRTVDGKDSVVVQCDESRTWMPDIDFYAACAIITCSYPSGFQLSAHNVTPPEPVQQYFTLGQKIVTNCELGYFTSSKANSVTSFCQIDGSWSPNPAEVVCTGTRCQSLAKIEHSTVKKFVLGSIKYGAVYTCDKGYIFRPQSASASHFFLTFCNFVKWYPTPNGKVCLPILCKNAPSIENAILVGNSISYDSVITVNCIPGYKLSNGLDEGKLVCKDGGVWDPASTLLQCEVIDCGPPISIVGAEVTYTTTEFQSEAIYKCQTGMTGMQRTVRCGATGRWEPLPSNFVKCENVFCPAPPYIRNAISLYGNTRSGGSWNYRCKSGFQVKPGVDKFSIRCNSAGNWGRKSPCTQTACGKPADIPSGYLAEHNMTLLVDGTLDQKAKYKCKTGTWFSDGLHKVLEYSITCNGGKWQPDLNKLRCVPITCPVPLPQIGKSYTTTGISNGDTMDFKSTISYQCPRGYYFRKYARNTITISCNANGAWSRNNLELDCEPVFCNLDVGDPHADWNDNVNPQIGAQLNVTCHPNYWYFPQVFSMIKTCDGNGQWLPYEKCVRISCPEPTSDRIDFELGPEGFFYVGSHEAGSIMKLSCKEGFYQQTTFDHLRCQSNGYWEPNPDSVLCNPHTCASFGYYPANGKVFGANFYNHTMTLQCNSKFMISPGVTSVSSRCLADKTWTVNLREYTCQPIECTFDPTQLDPDLTITLPASKYGYDESLKIVCRNGYSFEDGLTTRSAVCGLDAKFHPILEELNCDSVQCPLPESLGSVNLIYIEQSVGSKYSKNTWMLSQRKSVTATCLKYGTWSFKDENFKCLNIEQLQIRKEKSGLYQILYVPESQTNWLTFDERYAIAAFKSAIPISNDQEQATRVAKERKTGIIGFRSMGSNEIMPRMSNNSNLNESGPATFEKKQIIHSRQVDDQSNSVVQVVSSQFSNPSDTLSSDITYLLDGDSRTVWVPHLDDKELKFQLHLGSPHVVEELMLMGDIDGTLSLMFATHDGSLPEKKYGPISTRTMVQNGVISKQTKLNGYGALLMLSGFDAYPATIIQVKFSKPPYVREIGIKASPAKAVIISSNVIPSAYLAIPITLFLCYIIVAFFADRFFDKTYQLTWRSAGFTIQYRTKQFPGSNPALYFEVIPIMQSTHLCAANKRKRDDMYFECSPELKNLKIKFTLLTCKRCPRLKNSMKPWDFHNVKAAYNGTVWTSVRKFYLKPDSTKCILLKQPGPPNDYQKDGLVKFFKQHSLAFLCPIADLNYQINSYMSSLVNLSAAVLVTFTIAMLCQLRWETVANASMLTQFSWYEIVVRDLMLSFAIGSSFGTISLLLLRMHFIGFPFIKDMIKSTVMEKNPAYDTSDEQSKLLLSNKSSEISHCSHFDSNDGGNEKAKILSVHSQSKSTLNPSARVTDLNEFSLTKQILRKDKQWRKYLVPVTVSALAITVLTTILLNAQYQERVPAIHAAIGACVLFLLIGTLIENVLVTILVNTVQTKKIKTWSLKYDAPTEQRKQQSSPRKTVEGRWVRKSSHSRYRRDQSLSEVGLPIAINPFGSSSEVDLLSEIEDRIQNTAFYSLPDNQCNIEKIHHMVDYTEGAMDFDFILNADVDLYVKYQKENLSFEEIEKALGKEITKNPSNDEDEMYSSERQQWNQREWTDWTNIVGTQSKSSPDESKPNSPHQSKFHPQIVPEPGTHQVEKPTQLLEDGLETAKNATLIAKLEEKIENLEKKIDMHEKSNSADGKSQSAESLRRQLKGKVKPSMVKLPRTLVNEILKYSKEDNSQIQSRLIPQNIDPPVVDGQEVPDNQSFLNSKLYNYNPYQAGVVSYQVTSVHQMGSKESTSQPRRNRQFRENVVENPLSLPAIDEQSEGSSKDTGTSADICKEGAKSNEQIHAWNEKSSVLDDDSQNASTSGDSSTTLLSRKPSQALTVDSTLSSLEGLQSLKNAFVDIRQTLARDFSDVIKD